MANQSQFKHIEDAELIRAAPTGGTESRDELIRRYRGATFLIAQQIIGSREAAEDASQEALITRPIGAEPRNSLIWFTPSAW